MSYAEWREAIAGGLDQRLYPIEWLDWRVEQGSVRIFENDRAIILVELRRFPSGATEVHALTAAGELPAIRDLAPLAEAWGREMGCIRASVSSAPAWRKVLPDYQPHQLLIAKEL